jgi:hypothetical protein
MRITRATELADDQVEEFILGTAVSLHRPAAT